MHQFDAIVVGAGMAGASVAFELSQQMRVVLLEREEQPGYHSTGRSAAAFIPSYGFNNRPLRELTRASLPHLLEPAPDFSPVPLLHQRGLLSICAAEHESVLAEEFRLLESYIPNLARLETAQLYQRLPQLREGGAIHGMYEPDVFDIDVHALHQAYLRGGRSRGSELVVRADVKTIRDVSRQWQVETSQDTFQAPLLVNTAGAWSDEVARLAEVRPIGLQPLRRTAVLLDPPSGATVDDWSLVLSLDQGFYFKPDAGLLLVSPGDEHPSSPTDAQPDELDIAYAVDYAQQALQLDRPRVRQSWAGLRNFVQDRTPVIGFDSPDRRFYWLTAQGGHGIQTAVGNAQLAASQIFEQPLPSMLADSGFDPAMVAPTRLNRGVRSGADV